MGVREEATSLAHPLMRKRVWYSSSAFLGLLLAWGSPDMKVLSHVDHKPHAQCEVHLQTAVHGPELDYRHIIYVFNKLYKRAVPSWGAYMSRSVDIERT